MRFTAALIVCAASIWTAAAAPAAAQSLADLARQEAARRKTVTPGKVYTNDSLKPEPVPASPARAVPAPAGSTTASLPVAVDTPAVDGATPAAAATDTAGGVTKDEAYWRDRLQAERAAFERATLLLGALQGRANSLQTDFVNRDDPATRALVAAERQRILAELDRTRIEIDQRAKAIAAIQDEARRFGAPAAWYR